MAWHGMAWHGTARHGMAWHGVAWRGMACCGVPLLTCTPLRCPNAAVGGALVDVFVPEGMDAASSTDLEALDER